MYILAPSILSADFSKLGEDVKTVSDAETGELLGAHMVGEQVTEQIQGFGIAHHLEATDESLLSMIFAHPTLSEAMHESILAASGQPLHQ